MEPEALLIRQSLVEFIVRSFNAAESDFSLDESLIQQGIIDSFGLVEITAFIEKAHGVSVLESDMTREAFGSVNKMASFILNKQRAARP
jgi:acyl carrier protein